MHNPTISDRVVRVRAYLTDEIFGYDHWRAAQFCAPKDAKPAILLVCRDGAEQTAILNELQTTAFQRAADDV